MKNPNPLKIAAYVLTGMFLFMGSFLLFAALSGTPMNEMAMVGKFFPEPPEEVTPEAATQGVVEELDGDQRPADTVYRAASVPLNSFLLQSPFSSEELVQLQERLLAKITENEAMRDDLIAREIELETRERHLEDRWRELEEIRAALGNRELELAERDDELARDADAQEERERASWAAMSTLFAEGDPEELTPQLLTISPDKAAWILHELTGDRAAVLMNALEPDDYRLYMDAYRKAGF